MTDSQRARDDARIEFPERRFLFGRFCFCRRWLGDPESRNCKQTSGYKQWAASPIGVLQMEVHSRIIQCFQSQISGEAGR